MVSNWRAWISNTITPFNVMLLLIVCEIGLLTFWQGKLGVFYSGIVFTIVSLLIGLVPLIAIKNYREDTVTPREVNRFDRRAFRTIGLVIFVLGMLYTGYHFREIFRERPIDPAFSDVIPSVEFYVERLLAGEYPYKVHTAFGYTLHPTYLPMMWLPYVISEETDIGYRWVAYWIFMIGLLLYILFMIRRSETYTGTIVKSLAPFVFIRLLVKDEPDIFAHTIEAMITGFYFILAYSIFSGSALVRAGGLLVTLLSRFSLLFWAPIYGLILLYRKRMHAIIVGSLVVTGILLIYVWPFLSKDWGSFGRGLDYYTQAALGEWQIKGWQEEGAQLPHHLNQGLGLAAWYYTYVEGSVLERILLMKQWHLLMSIIAALSSGVLYFFIKKQIDYRVYSLLALKFYLTFFYAFIQVPYAYLYMMPVFLSLFVFAMVSFKMRFPYLDYKYKPAAVSAKEPIHV